MACSKVISVNHERDVRLLFQIHPFLSVLNQALILFTLHWEPSEPTPVSPSNASFINATSLSDLSKLRVLLHLYPSGKLSLAQGPLCCGSRLPVQPWLYSEPHSQTIPFPTSVAQCLGLHHYFTPQLPSLCTSAQIPTFQVTITPNF